MVCVIYSFTLVYGRLFPNGTQWRAAIVQGARAQCKVLEHSARCDGASGRMTGQPCSEAQGNTNKPTELQGTQAKDTEGTSCRWEARQGSSVAQGNTNIVNTTACQ
ncbi:hypothetical protein CBR_g17774 [Chara braunii]|uniref:Uncharacterized protein n=1 Tax=Chara braunii TaxID=69332 RepID=A0A388KVG5_CHABU|nr:hypothetical protein CBR_g17774 [Chara braunii]|eukprot:GBG74064.1 hypothetical protein CBR_g17774 [Chara braunii]